MRPKFSESSLKLLRAACEHVSAGNNVWDIGANVGLFSIAAAHTVGPTGRVLAVEADPFLASLVQRSIQIPANKDLNVSTLCAAASDGFSIARFLIAERGRASSSLEKSGHRSQAGGTRHVQYVPTVTLDQLLDVFGAPDFIKVDVEGAEEFVLKGAKVILANSRPVFYIEVGKEQSVAIADIFRRANYVLRDGDAVDDIRIEKCAFNTLAIPAERA
ncbi:FkbM family methyltransferase [Novipirellula sp. SH528]|uniref:FkbM family methyltransferase n=1 Tax=Novipirellula sp. SH528 TaxID=3454466 RepID=UPI003FA129BF